MIVLVGAMATLGYIDIRSSSNGFNEYRVNARVNVGVSDMQSALARAVASSSEFMRTHDNEHMDNASKELATLEKLCSIIMEETQSQARKEFLAGVLSTAQSLRTMQNNVRIAITNTRAIYDNDLRPNVQLSRQTLDSLGDLSFRLHNINSLNSVRDGYSKLAMADRKSVV